MSDELVLTETSVVVAVWHRLTAGLTTDESRTGIQSSQLFAVLSRALVASNLATLSRRLAHWTRHSFLYSWPIAKSHPEIIVIDLRETYTVGPILVFLDRLVTPLFGVWQTARTGSLAETTTNALRANPVRTVSFVVAGALLTNLTISLVFGTLSSTALGLRLFFFVLAALGTRVHLSWEQCTESVTYQSLVAALQPPEPPGPNNSSDDSEQ